MNYIIIGIIIDIGSSPTTLVPVLEKLRPHVEIIRMGPIRVVSFHNTAAQPRTYMLYICYIQDRKSTPSSHQLSLPNVR